MSLILSRQFCNKAPQFCNKVSTSIVSYNALPAAIAGSAGECRDRCPDASRAGSTKNRFREAKVKRSSRLGGSKIPGWRVGVCSGGRFRFFTPGTTKCLTRESGDITSEAPCFEEQGTAADSHAGAPARKLTGSPASRPQSRNSLWSSLARPLLYRGCRIVPSLRL